MADTRLVWDRAAIRGLRTDPGVTRMIENAGDVMARAIRALAPKDTGAGAESIEARQARRAVGATDVGWDADHWYMIFPEFGTKHQRAQRFARNVLDRYTYH